MPCELTAETSFSRQPQRLGQGRRRGACRQHRKARISVVTCRAYLSAVWQVRHAGACHRLLCSLHLLTALISVLTLQPCIMTLRSRQHSRQMVCV